MVSSKLLIQPRIRNSEDPSLFGDFSQRNESHIKTILIARMTTRNRSYPSRVSCIFQEKTGEIVLDQIRAVDKERLLRHLGTIDEETLTAVLDMLARIFAR